MKAYMYDVFHHCETVTDWLPNNCSIVIDSTQKVEGKTSIKMTSDAGAKGRIAYTKEVNWTEHQSVVFSVYHPGWTNETGRISLWNDIGNWSSWNFDFAGEWTEIEIVLSSTPDDSLGTLDLSSIAWITVYEENLEDPGEDYYFDFFRGKSIDVSDYVQNIRLVGGIFPIKKSGSFLTHPDHEAYFRKGDTLEILDDSDNTVFLGVITDKNRSTDGLYKYVLESYYNEAHYLNYVKVFSSDKSSEKIQDIVDNSFNFITRDSSITATTIDYDYDLNRASAALLNLIRFLERQVIYIESEGKMVSKDYDGLTKAPQHFGATYNFRDESVGTSGTDIDFVDTATLYDGACEIVSNWQGHKKVLRLQDDVTAGEDPLINHDEIQATAGTREFWIGTDNINIYSKISFREVNTEHFIVGINGDLRYWNGGWNVFKAAANDILYHVKVEWYVDDTFDIWINGILEVNGAAMNGNQISGINNVRISLNGDITDYLYLDSWGDPDNDPNYTVGDNYVAWDVSSHHQSIMLIDAKEFKTGYYKGSLGITRASVRMDGNVIRTKPDDRADTEQAIGVIPLKEYRDLKLVATTEADQLATNLYNIFSKETEFIALRIEGEGYVSPGETLQIRNTGSIPIATGNFCVISYVYDPKSDIYLEMIVSNNVVFPSEFMSRFDTTALQIHQANLQTFENKVDIDALVSMTTGTYMGNDVDNRQITGFGFTPKSVIISNTDAVLHFFNDQMTVWKTSSHLPASTSYDTNVAKIIADGIELNNGHASDRANMNGIVYTYTAWG